MTAQKISLIVGLGNPGDKYEKTRHNAGFWFLDEVARRYAGSFKTESRFSGDACKVDISGQPVWLLKPGTFMNRSGSPVRQLSQFYKIPEQEILVAHDELDLEAGDSRLKKAGGHGGHNGLRDIIAQVGKEFWRMRLGIGHPGTRDLVTGYVLGRPAKDDEAAILRSIDNAADVLELIVAGEMEKAMHRLHSR